MNRTLGVEIKYKISKHVLYRIGIEDAG